MQDSKRVLGFNCKWRIEQLNFFDWLWNVKNLVLWNGSELVRNVIQWDLNSFFSQKLTKITQRLGALPQTPIAIGGWGLCPQTSVSDTFENTSLLNTSSKLDFYTFQQLVFFCPLPLPKSWQSAIWLRLQIFHSTISLPHKKLLFRKFLMASLRVICGLAPPPPQSKILATPMI